MIGQTISHYQIQDQLGQGGMGVVYKALDTRLDRTVALKFLSTSALPTDDDKVRFYREAKAAAKLNHPHIATVYAIDETEPAPGEPGGQAFIAMEYVEGETLAEKIKRGPLKLQEAITIATQIAEGLQAAHERGVVHRDVKSSNVMLDEQGQVKIMDFGLAMTTASTRLTRTGSTMGTVAYMSPEQARGEAVDHHTDLWSLGVVLYEMISGRLPFGGDYEQAVVYAILNEDPEALTGLRTGVPMALERVVMKCLMKDPAARYQHTDEVAVDLKAIDVTATDTSRIATTTTTTKKQAMEQRVLSWRTAVLTGVVIALAAGLAGWYLGRSTDAPKGLTEVIRFSVSTPVNLGMADLESPLLTMAPDGSAMVYVSDGRLHVQRLDRFESYPLEGTEGADDPFISPDSRIVGFSQFGRLRGISIEGGPIRDLSDVQVLYNPGATWGETDLLVYSSGSTGEGLMSVQLDASEPTQVTRVLASEGEKYHQWPQLLDGDRLVLFTVIGPGGLWKDARLVLADLETGDRTTVREKATFGRYVSTGHILYVDDRGTLFALPFDLDRRKVTGSPYPVLSGILVARWGGAAWFAVSDDGKLAFVRGTHALDFLLRWVDRSGQRISDVGPPMLFGSVRLSPDGATVATWLMRPTNADLYLLDAETGEPMRFTSDPAWDWQGVWSPDQQRIAYSTARLGFNVIYVKDLAGGADPVLLYEGAQELWPTSWSPGAEGWIAFNDSPFGSKLDVRAVRVDGGDEVMTIADSEDWECCARFSPDGRWVAYQSDENSGRPEIWVVSFPDLSNRRQVSRGGGIEPRWSPRGNELFFWQDSTLMAASVSTDSPPRFGPPRPLFTEPGVFTDRIDLEYDVSPDGDRFLLRVLNPDIPPRQIQVILNWFTILKEAEGQDGL